MRELRSAEWKSRAARGPNVPHPATSHLVAESCEVTLKALVLALQGLDAGQVVAVVVSVQSLILLLNPLFGLIRISVGRRADGDGLLGPATTTKSSTKQKTHIRSLPPSLLSSAPRDRCGPGRQSTE